MIISAVQMHSTTDVRRNLSVALDLMARAVDEGAGWIVLPEHFHWAGTSDLEKLKSAEELETGPSYQLCQRFARDNKVNVHAGSIFERIPGEARIYNTTVAFDRAGAEVARYRKVHLFDITAPDGASYQESKTVKPGDEFIVYRVDDLTVGCAICYDVRFSDLFLALANKGADLIALPAAFNSLTGLAHWEPLLRARAIETQTYIAASASVSAAGGGGGRKSFGHSMLVDPWGRIATILPEGDGVISCEVDPKLLQKVRQDIPMAAHRRQELYKRWAHHG